MNTSFNILVFDLKKLHIACVHTILTYIRVICYIHFYNLLKTKRNSTLLIYTMHNKFSNFLFFASFLCSSLCSADQFQLQ